GSRPRPPAKMRSLLAVMLGSARARDRSAVRILEAIPPRHRLRFGSADAAHDRCHIGHPMMMRTALAFVLAAIGFTSPDLSSAQVQRQFPKNALRGSIVVGEPPTVELNGRETRF